MKVVEVKNNTHFMDEEDERLNIQNFIKLLPHFFYTEESNRMIIEAIENREHETFYALDKFLNLNPFDRRRWFKINLPKQMDKAFSIYRDIIYTRFCDERLSPGEYALLTEYQVFKDGYFKKDGNKVKLFRYLLKHHLITQSQIDEINKYKQRAAYICISRNPVDYLFSATDQSFSTCESLSSDYEGAYYMGLGGLPSDPNRCLIFLTNGKTKKYDIKGLIFKHFRYTQRSWCLWGDQEELVLIRDYPEPKINFSDILTEIGFIAKYALDGQQTCSMLDFSLPILQSGDVMGMYYDNIGLVGLVNNKYQYNSFDGATNSSFCPGFNWDLGFEEVECLEDLYEGPAKCKNCSAHISRMSAFSYEGYYYCEKCFEEHFTPCAFCGAVVKNEDAFISSIDGPLCEQCFSSTYRFCERCGNLVLLENIEDEEEIFCDECVRQYNQFNISISPFSKTVEDIRRAA